MAIYNSICTKNTPLNIVSGTGEINIGVEEVANKIITIGGDDATGNMTILRASSGCSMTLNNNNIGQSRLESNSTTGTTVIAGATVSIFSLVNSLIINGGVVTKPVSSNTSTTAFGTSLTAGTSIQNTLGYDILVNIAVAVTSSTTATIVMGIGSTSTPTTNTVIPSFTVATFTNFSFSAIVPNSYYLLVNTTGTITIGSITTQVCPL